MLHPAVTAAAVALWLLAVLGPGLSLPDEDSSDPDFSLCRHCFYRQTPPQGVSHGPLLRPLCHTLLGGQTFATLSKPTCDVALFSAFRLSRGRTEREGDVGGEPVTVEEGAESLDVAVPSLLRGEGDPSHPPSPTDSLQQHWDSVVTALVQSNITPQCSTSEGDLYILTGVGEFRAAEDGGDDCQIKPLWSAVCCAAPEGKGGFSVALIKEPGEAVRQVSVKELEEKLEVAELFSGGCGADAETVGIIVGLHSEELLENKETLVDDQHSHAGRTDSILHEGDLDTAGQDTVEGEVGSDTTNGDSKENIKENGENLITGDHVDAVDAQPEEPDVKETPADAATSESDGEGRSKGTDSRAADQEETESGSSSTLVYVLSTTVSILKMPLEPVFSRITQFPGQVTYVLQEDLGVLSTVAGDTLHLFNFMTSDLLSWVGSAVEMLLGVGERCFCSVYHCSSAMLGALLDSCYTGITGTGTLAGDTAGIFGGALDNGWWVTRFFGGRLWEQSETYVGTVMSEVGGQAKAVGGGLGKLVWKSGKGVVNVFRMGGGLILGTVDMIFGAAREGFGQESE